MQYNSMDNFEILEHLLVLQCICCMPEVLSGVYVYNTCSSIGDLERYLAWYVCKVIFLSCDITWQE